MSFGEAIKTCFTKYATFKGRAQRSEYWYFFLFNFLVCAGLRIIEYFLLDNIYYISGLYSLAVFVPVLAVEFRRLHDIGKKGWYSVLLRVLCLIEGLLGFQWAITLLAMVFGRRELKTQAQVYEVSLLILLAAIVVLSIILLVWLCRDSDPNENQYGPNPKEINKETTVEP